MGPLIKLIAKVDSLDRWTKGKIYPAKRIDHTLEFFDNNDRKNRITMSKATKYFHLCDCGTWSGGHDKWCVYLK